MVSTCMSNEDTSKAGKQNATQLVLPVATPFWTYDLSEEPQSGFFLYQTTIHQKPPFFNGSIPLVFTERRGVSGSSGRFISYSFRFEAFRNHFIYKNPNYRFSGLAEGAITYTGTNLKRAEARVTKPNSGNDSLEIEEIHYGDDQKPVFYCKSEISYRTGFKVREYEAKGTKSADYFFMWPVHTN